MDDLRQEYFFKGGDTGVLLIHGFTSAPAELYELGRACQGAGYTVLGARLAGHGTAVEDFARTGAAEWLASAEEAYARLAAVCPTVCVIGHSMGGLLAMLLARKHPVKRLVLLAPALKYRQWYVSLAGLACKLVKDYTWPAEERTPEQLPYMLHYQRFPMSRIAQMTRLQSQARAAMGGIRADTLLVVAKRDTLVHSRMTRLFNQNYRAPLCTLRLNRSGHSVTTESEKDTVFCACLKFLAPASAR